MAWRLAAAHRSTLSSQLIVDPPVGRILTSMKVLAALVLLLAAAWSAEGARILAVIPIPARSHHIAFYGVTRALADRGHDVTLATGLEKGTKIIPANNKVIYLGNPFKELVGEELKGFWEKEPDPHKELMFLMKWGTLMVNATMSNPDFRAVIDKPGQKFDLIISEAFFFQEGFVGLGYKFNAPVVAINAFGTTPWINDVMGNPVNPAWVPLNFLGFSDHMSLKERLINSVMYVVSYVTHNYQYMPTQEAVYRRHFPDAPPLQDALRAKVALTLVNNHFTLAYPAPMSPNVVEIGGGHIVEKTKPLPKDLQDYIDSAKDGVVFFSMGSNLRMTDMPKEKSEAILAAMGEIKQKVLFKWEGAKPTNVAPNVRLIDWAPQADILAHPNVRVFVTHGGLLSTQESAYYGVPLVGIPVFGDQYFNTDLAVNKGYCIRLNFRTMTKDDIVHALKEIVDNPKYKEAASRLAGVFRSKPMKPAETAIFWVEHVMQHGGDHLRPASVHLPLYQLLLVDVILVLLAPVAALLLCCRALCCKKRTGAAPVSDSKKSN